MAPAPTTLSMSCTPCCANTPPSVFTATQPGRMLRTCAIAGAYLTEIQRAGFESVRKTEMEAAEVLGFSRAQQVRYVIMPHVARVLFPPLSNHYILMTLGTSMAAIFGVDELTGRAFNVNAETFRSIEVFSVVALMYIVITLCATVVLSIIGRLVFRARMRII